jgi:pimeloyl-ACP methyl ester carboxylesterase
MRVRSIGVLVAAVVSLSLAACAGQAGSPASAGMPTGTSSAAVVSPTAARPAESTSKPTVAPGPGDVVYVGSIDIGGDRSLQVRCIGVGAPTILLEGGGIAPSMDAFPYDFVKALGEATTTCQYSQAGTGGSSALPGTRTMAGVVADAYALLDALKQKGNVPGPYIFAGWSFGGEVALAEALAHPDRTKGLVILDTDFVVDFMKTCLAAGRQRADCQAEFDGDIEAKALEAELVPTIHPLPDIPLRIVSAMQFPGCSKADPSTLHASIGGKEVTAADCSGLAGKIADLQRDGWSTVNPALQQIRVEADHDGLVDQAGDQIVREILDLVTAARATS